ncbi:MAG: hypothetical protein CM1200mP14_05820 [Gammaproteobacteria bacterium]|nr:MAG: hypothetical protein CM1200mP14_05820 [Gammaproteobacteria bacterium]
MSKMIDCGTGTDQSHAQGDVIERVRRFNPGVPIPAEVTAIHGITDEDIANEPTFCLRAKSLSALIEDADLAGFNKRGFALQCFAEFKRCGIKLEVRNRRLIDMQNIFHREEPRALFPAPGKILPLVGTKRKHIGLGDKGTISAVLSAQLNDTLTYLKDFDGLHKYCDEIRPFRTGVDLWFRGPPEERVFIKGKNKGKKSPTSLRQS